MGKSTGTKAMRESRDGETVGITLRVKKRTWQAYSKMALEANLAEVNKGQSGGVTVQEMMRQRLESHPEITENGGGDD